MHAPQPAAAATRPSLQRQLHGVCTRPSLATRAVTLADCLRRGHSCDARCAPAGRGHLAGVRSHGRASLRPTHVLATDITRVLAIRVAARGGRGPAALRPLRGAGATRAPPPGAGAGGGGRGGDWCAGSASSEPPRRSRGGGVRRCATAAVGGRTRARGLVMGKKRRVQTLVVRLRCVRARARARRCGFDAKKYHATWRFASGGGCHARRRRARGFQRVARVDLGGLRPAARCCARARTSPLHRIGVIVTSQMRSNAPTIITVCGSRASMCARMSACVRVCALLQTPSAACGASQTCAGVRRASLLARTPAEFTPACPYLSHLSAGVYGLKMHVMTI